MFGKMALDWTQEMERRLYEKICGRLTCCGEEEEAGSGKGALIYYRRGSRFWQTQRVSCRSPFLAPDILGLEAWIWLGKTLKTMRDRLLYVPRAMAHWVD